MSAVVIPFPTRPTLSAAERALVVHWKRTTPGVTHVFINARRPSDPAQVQDRILIVGDETPVSGWIVHRPARKWVVRKGVGMEPVGESASLAEALAMVETAAALPAGRSAAAAGTLAPHE